MSQADLIGAYVAELGSYLDGPRRAKRDVLREVRHGLSDATEGLEDSGCEQEEAQRRAIAEFGGAQRLAGQFQSELAAKQMIAALVSLAVFGPVAQLVSQLVWANTQIPRGARPDEAVMTLAVAVDWLSLVSSVVAVLALLAACLGARRAAFSPRVARVVGVAMVMTLVAIALGSALLVRAFMVPSQAAGGLWGQACVAAISLGGLAVAFMVWRCLRVAGCAARLVRCESEAVGAPQDCC